MQNRGYLRQWELQYHPTAPMIRPSVRNVLPALTRSMRIHRFAYYRGAEDIDRPTSFLHRIINLHLPPLPGRGLIDVPSSFLNYPECALLSQWLVAMIGVSASISFKPTPNSPKKFVRAHQLLWVPATAPAQNRNCVHVMNINRAFDFVLVYDNEGLKHVGRSLNEDNLGNGSSYHRMPYREV